MVKSSLKGRFVDVYLPNVSTKARWRAEADQQGISLSEWISCAVESYLTDLEMPRNPADNMKMQEEIKRLREEAKNRDAALRQAETDLFRLRHGAFLSLDISESREYAGELIKLLKAGGVWRAEKLLETLGINPKDLDAIKILANQLQALRGYGLVSETLNGWRWNG